MGWATAIGALAEFGSKLIDAVRERRKRKREAKAAKVKRPPPKDPQCS